MNPIPLFTNINGSGGEVTLVSDAHGVLHAVIRGVEGDQAAYDTGAVVYIESTNGGQTWTPFEYIDPDYDGVPNSIGVSTDISLALDSQGHPAVTYWRSKQERWCARRGADGTWRRSLVTVMPYTGLPYTAQLDFDPQDTPVTAYDDRATNQVRLARPVPTGVTPPIDIAVTGTVSPSFGLPGASLTWTPVACSTAPASRGGAR